MEHFLRNKAGENKKEQQLLKRWNEALMEGTCLVTPDNFKMNGNTAVSKDHAFSILGHREHPNLTSSLLGTSSHQKTEREQTIQNEQEADEENHFLERMTAIMQGSDDDHDYHNPEDKNLPQGSVYDNDEDANDIPSYIPSYKKDELGGALSHHVTHQSHPHAQHLLRNESQCPVEHAQLTLPPNVPPPVKRVVVDLYCTNKKMKIRGNKKFEYWPFGFYDKLESKLRFSVPGPFIRARVGDVLQINFTNADESGMAHSVDLHAVVGPGGGSPTNFAEQDETKVGAYLLQKPGLYVYHCAAAPIPLHIHNGMFGLILVEPREGLPPVDKEFYIMQSDLYCRSQMTRMTMNTRLTIRRLKGNWQATLYSTAKKAR